MASPVGEDRFTQYTSTNHAAWLWIVTIFSIVFAVAVLLFRVRERLKTYSFDDVAATSTFVRGLEYNDWTEILTLSLIDLCCHPLVAFTGRAS